MVGTILLLAAVGALFRRFVSSRAGLVSIVVVGMLATVGSLGALAQEGDTSRQIREALDEAGLDDDPVDLTPEETACVETSGFEPEDLLTALTDTGAEGTLRQLELFDVVARCAPRVLLADDGVEDFRRSFSSGMSGEISAGEARCILEQIVAHPRPSELLDGSSGDVFPEILEGCLSDESLAIIRGEAGAGPQTVGEDPELDRLTELCRDGESMACDLLYVLTSPGSDYFAVADDCGGRALGGDISCTPGFVDDDVDGLFDAGSPGWPATVAACEGGDMLACDFAYRLSQLGSEVERVGETCGGRQAFPIAESCRSRYGEQADPGA